MDPVFWIVFVFGLFIGSFLNVVVARTGTGITMVSGRSICFSCGKMLYWYELIPLVSFFVQDGKCRGCGARISRQYPLIEFATGLVFALIYERLAAVAVPTAQLYVTGAFYVAIFGLLVVISAYDIRHKIIPDNFVYPFIAIAGAGLFLFSSQGLPYIHLPDIWSVLAGPLLALPFFLLWFVSKGTWMGFADSKLAWGIGWILGPSMGTSAIILGFWIGAIVGIVMIIYSKAKRLSSRKKRFTITMKSELPFGPFLALGAFMAWFFNIGIITLMLLFSFN